ncbi:hypothetical protein ABZ769_15305 [Streptomyces olivoreticuli]
MSDVSGLAKGVGQFTASRFAVVGYLPSYAAVLYVTALLAARTRTGRIDPGRALDRLHGLSAAELIGGEVSLAATATSAVHGPQYPA